MDPQVNVAHQRLSVLQLAEALGNVSEACRQRGVTRTQFYEYKRRFQAHGIKGPKELRCYRLSDALKHQGISVSGSTVQNTLALPDPLASSRRLSS